MEEIKTFCVDADIQCSVEKVSLKEPRDISQAILQLFLKFFMLVGLRIVASKHHAHRSRDTMFK